MHCKMAHHPALIKHQDIENRIFTIRGVQVMLDSDLSELYGVETKRLNEQVKRNKDRFPRSFMFQLREKEIDNLRSQFATSSVDYGGRRYLPYVFTEQGVAMLSAILRSETAVKVSIQIMQAFVQMRKFITENAAIFQRLDKVERKQIESDEKFEQLFDALQSKDPKSKRNSYEHY